MAKILIRGKIKDLRIPRGQFALVSTNKQMTKKKLMKEGKFSVASIVNVGTGKFLFKLKKKK